tara:strand:+ start:13589 stop:15013 length:1425 start_codon:yes stop_codon:yes gene_type:complete
MLKTVLLLVFTSLSCFLWGQAYKIDPIAKDSALFKAPYKIVSQIQLIGNKRTKNHIVTREILVNVGDMLENEAFFEALEQSRKNILNTSLFNFTRVDIALIDSVHASIIIHLTEKWYIIPLPIFEIDDNNFNTWLSERDYNRINYGLNVTDYNFRGRNERLSATVKYGFTKRLSLRYSIPYIDKNQKIGLGFNFSYNRREQIVYNSFDNKRLQFRSDEDAWKNLNGGINIIYRRRIFDSHSFGISYNKNSIIDSVKFYNENFLGENRNSHQFISLFYNFVSDKRDSRSYPLKGSYFNFNVVKYGLGITKSNVDLINFQVQVKKFLKLKERLFLAGSLRGVVAGNNNQPYILQNGLGYSSFAIRAYELYVIDGQNIGLAKAQIRYQLVQPRVKEIPSLPKKFNRVHYAVYLGLFTDMGYVEDNTGFPLNTLANKIQYSSGIGLDFVSYYDIVIRTEFSINKFGQSGLFFHFVAPI